MSGVGKCFPWGGLLVRLPPPPFGVLWHRALCVKELGHIGHLLSLSLSLSLTWPDEVTISLSSPTYHLFSMRLGPSSSNQAHARIHDQVEDK